MYIPSHFSETDPARLHAVMRDFDFATLMTQGVDASSTPMISHLPLPLEEECLVGHVARANPHWRLFDGRTPALAIFQGPHGYVSPRWYLSAGKVPTWNYQVVHATGKPRVVEDRERCRSIMERLVATYETGEDGWRLDRLPDGVFDAMLRGIVIFEMPVERLEGKFKLSQDKKAEDRDGVIRHLSSSTSAVDRELAARMAEV